MKRGKKGEKMVAFSHSFLLAASPSFLRAAFFPPPRRLPIPLHAFSASSRLLLTCAAPLTSRTSHRRLAH